MKTPLHFQQKSGHWQAGLWAGYALLLGLAPLVFDGGLGQTLLAQTGIAIIACLSYNLLLGQGGMLSFGHAVYSGMGAYVAMHTLNHVSAGWGLPVSLVPLAGGLGAALLALLLGWVSTKKSGTALAMITFGMGELVWACALVFADFFGGEAGVSGNRVAGHAWAGITFGPQIELNYLIAAYTLGCTALLYALTRTPLGRLLNAVRDNPQRAAFIGCNPQRVRYQAFVIAAFFAGVAGGLAALNFELVTTEVFSAQRSGAYLLFTVLGGTGYFFGPIIGALLMVLSNVLLSSLTPAWLLYVGLLFVLMVRYAPGGVAALLVAGWPLMRGLARQGNRPRVWLAGVALVAAAGLALAGFAALVEMIYQQQQQGMLGPQVAFLGLTLQVQRPLHWLLALLAMLSGVLLLGTFRRHLARHWQRAGLAGPTAVPVMPGTKARTASPQMQFKPRLSLSLWERVRAGCPALVPQMNPLAAGIKHDCHLNPPVLQLKGLRKAFGSTEIIRHFSLSVQQGERIGLIGPNGAGKSTLFDLISGRTSPSAGEVWLAGVRTDGRAPFEINRLGLSRSFQVSSLFGGLTVFDNLRCAVLWHLGYRYTLLRGLDRLPDVNACAEHWLWQLQLQDQRNTPAARLGYADQRALELGITLASGAQVILLDEPTAGMSQSESASFMALIDRVTVGKTLLIIEHDMTVLFGLAGKIAVISDGVLLAFDTPAAVRANPLVQQAYLGQEAAVSPSDTQANPEPAR